MVTKMVNVKPPASFCAIDASTNSFAFCIYQNGKVARYGKIKFHGTNINEKIDDIAKKSKAFFDEVPVDVIVIEDTIYTNSHNTAAQLAKSQGALLAGAYLAGVKKVYSVSPIAWQSYVGTRLLTAAEKAEIKTMYPGKSQAWYKDKERMIRKGRTIDTVNKKFNFKIDDDDVADSAGIMIYASENWGKVIRSKK